jgi:hypothetical protein
VASLATSAAARAVAVAARMGGMRVAMGGAPGMDIGALMRGTANVDSILDAALRNPVKDVLALRDSLGLTAEQVTSIQLLADTVDAQHARRRADLEPALQQVAASAGGRSTESAGAPAAAPAPDSAASERRAA